LFIDILGRLRSQKRRGLVYNPHFWILIVITAAITGVYYLRFIVGVRPEWLWPLEMLEFRSQFHGLLFCIPLFYTAVIFWWRGLLIMWLVSVAITLPLMIQYRPFFFPVLVNVFYLCIPLLIVGYITLELNWRNKERSALLEREQERQTYIAQIFKAQENERKRLAQELHDDTIHSLLVIASRVENMANNGSDGEGIKNESKAVRGEIIRLSDDLRRLTLDLRPGILDNIGFIPALRWLIDRLNQEGQIDTSMVIEGDERNIPHGPDVIMFRIVQEALNNIRFHSQAAIATLTLRFSQENVEIIVADNGKGFNLPKRMDILASKGKLGLMGIQERAHSLNGTLDIRSKPKQGTSISVKFKV
jgi:two-component system sensor histidine kinase DegS